MFFCVDFFTGSDSIHGTWCKDILQTIMNFTPHNWASHTLSCFPAPLQVRCGHWGMNNTDGFKSDAFIQSKQPSLLYLCFSYSQAFFKQNNVPQESRFNLKKNVEEEYRKWKSMANENDIITHFSMQGSPPLFLCLLWKMLLETDHINQIGFRFDVIILCSLYIPLQPTFSLLINLLITFLINFISCLVYKMSKDGENV